VSLSSIIPAAEAIQLAELITPVTGGIASKVLAKSGGGNVTLFAFDAGAGLGVHTTPFDVLVLTTAGALTLTIGGQPVVALPGTIIRLPANVPHAVDAPVASQMLLITLREP
jgi:quercetin dioxygenase-like cupin family protein